MRIPERECYDRVNNARQEMVRHSCDAIIVTDPINFEYFTGQRVPLWTRSRPAIFVLPVDQDPVVIDWSGPEMFAKAFNGKAPGWVVDRRIYPEVPFQRNTPVDWGLAKVLREKGLDKKRIGIELGYETRLNLAIEDFELLKCDVSDVKWKDSGKITWPCRMIKSAWEIENIRRACEIGVKAWGSIFSKLYVGISVEEIRLGILDQYKKLGADADSEVQIVLGASGDGNQFVEGDILYLDGGCRVNGYRADFTRRAVFGKPSKRQLGEHNGMWDILFRVIEKMKPGTATREIFAYSQSLLSETKWLNYSDHPAKRIGHGIGLASEPPYINEFDENILLEGMSITPEPKIFVKEGLLNPEEHVLIGKNGAEILSEKMNWQLYAVN